MDDTAIVANTATQETGGDIEVTGNNDDNSDQPSATTLIPDAPLACNEWTKKVLTGGTTLTKLFLLKLPMRRKLPSRLLLRK